MKHKCLIVDDDAAIRRVAARVAISLNHGHAEAASMESARKRLTDVTYILLDMELPETDSRGFPRIQNGLNLLEEWVQSPETAHIPIIVMTAHGKTDPTLAVEVLTAGAANWINKPFPATGRTLDKVIKETLSKRTTKQPPVDIQPRKGQHFAGGELSFQPSHISLLGHKIAGDDSLIRNIYEELSVKDQRGVYVKFTAEEFAERFRCDGGASSVRKAIADSRKKIVRTLLDREGIICTENDVIQSVDGYQLKVWITVNRQPSVEERPRAAEPANPKNTSEGRRAWILDQVRNGVELRLSEICAVFKCSKRTALRDTEMLKKEGLLDFQGEPLRGYYVLRK
jgi:CheY-like chemotaxis protein